MQHNSRRAAALAVAVALLTSIGLATSPPANAEAAAAVPVIRLDGRGHGHGVGMSQWGAYTMASKGASAAEIIGAFYPGTQLSQLGGEVVVVIDRRDHVRIAFPGGGEVRSARSGPQHAGFPMTVAPGGTVDIVRTPDGYRVSGGSVAALSSASAVRYSSRAQDCVLFLCEPDDGGGSPAPTTTTTTAPPPSGDGGGGGPVTEPAPSPGPSPTTAPPPQQGAPPQDSGAAVSPTPVWAVAGGGSLLRSVDRARTYRGVLEVTGPPGGVKVRNHLDIEDYLKGMAEVPGSWPAAAVQAQAIAARTYAMRAMAAGGELCDSESCQVYSGTAHESPGQVAAVDATRGVVVTHGGGLASTFYSASGGGFSANVAEGFGSGHDVPYLPARPYETAHPDEWSVDIALTDVARRLGYAGSLHEVTVDETGPSGRPLRMTLHGDAGPRDVDPQDFRRRLGLRSTLFEVRSAETETAPPPPPEAPDPGVVGDVVTAEPPVVRPSVDALSVGEVALAAPEPSAERAFGLVAAATVLLGLAGLATVGRLAGLAPTFLSDGVRHHRILGAPFVGVAWSKPESERLRATMARWSRRQR